MRQLYTTEKLDKLEEVYKQKRILLLVLSGLTFVVFVVLCILTNTGNSALMENVSTVIVMVAGWLLIYFGLNSVAPAKAEIRHGRMLTEEKADEYCGTLDVDEKDIRIKGSITIRHLLLTENGEKKRLNVIACKADELKELTGRVKLLVVHGYVAAYGRADENI